MDIQGDEPLISPKDIDNLISFHLRNNKFDIVLPSIYSKKLNENENVVKVVKSKKNKVLKVEKTSRNNFTKNGTDYVAKDLYDVKTLLKRKEIT